MRELAQVVVAVAATSLILWGVRVWSWVSYCLGRWPWLIERYAVIFPLLLVVALLVLRRWRPMRSSVVAAVAGGAAAGLIASLLSLVLAQVITAPERANLWNSLDLAGAGVFLLVELFFALFLTLGWLYGALASAMALLADRAARRFQRSSEEQVEESPADH
ncbi:MAG: hypothetical protein GY953_34525 [bacterium]|nr:hypothetical protein [bacterium]